MFKTWKFTLFFLLCLVVALLLTLPVMHLMPWVKLPATVQTSTINGTVLKGKVALVTFNQFPFRGVSYRFLPSCIPTLKICYDLKYDQGSFQVAYDLLSGSTVMTDANLDYPASQIKLMNPTLLANPTGKLQIEVSKFALIDGKPGDVIGKLTWRDLGIEEIESNLGDYKIDFSGSAAGYNFKLSDLDAALDVEGGGKVEASGVYDIDISIESDIRIDQNIKTILDLAAASTGHNKYRIAQKGVLPVHIVRQLF
jgi:hypothetical protein